MPRLLNGSMAGFLLLLTVPVFTHLGGRALWVQLVLLWLSLPVLLVVFLCLCSSLRPGSLGRFFGRLKARRKARPARRSRATG